MSKRTKRIERLVRFAWDERAIRRHHAKMNFEQSCKIGELKEALRPFAKFAGFFSDEVCDHRDFVKCGDNSMTVGDFRRARKAVGDE